MTMLARCFRKFGRVGAAAGLLLAPAAAHAAAPAGSSAFAFSARLASGGSVTGIPEVAAAAGALPKPYKAKTAVASINETVGIASGALQIATLSVAASGLQGTASSSGFGVDALSVTAGAAVSTLSVSLVQYPPPPGTVLPLPLLSLTASAITTQAYDTLVVPQTPRTAATARFSALTISGQLLGGKTLTFSGNAAPNTHLFSNAQVTITLNRNLVAGLISCTPSCVFSPYGITADAISIELHNANVGGRRLSGTIVAGETQASIP